MLTPLRKLIHELEWHKNEYILFVVSLIVPGIICFFSINVFIEIAEGVQARQLVKFDNLVFDFIHDFRSDALTDVVIFITNLGDGNAYAIIIPAVAVLLYYRGHHRWKLSLQATIVLASAYFINVGLKHYISRPRPVEALRLVAADSYSFPSGHTMSATAFYGFTIYLTYKYVANVPLKTLLILMQTSLMITIGLSRIYLGVHFPTDVVAGFFVGLFWLILCIAIFNLINLYRKRQARKRNVLHAHTNK